MAAKKLTLRLEEEAIEKAKTYSEKTGRSVSRIVQDFFTLLGEGDDGSAPIHSAVASLKGALRGAEVNEKDYRQHLEDRHL